MRTRADKRKFTLVRGTEPRDSPVLLQSEPAPRQPPRSLFAELRAFARYLITGKTDARKVG